MSIPTEATFDAVACAVSIAGYDILVCCNDEEMPGLYQHGTSVGIVLYLDSTSEQVPIVWQTSGERWSVKEGEWLFVSVELLRSLKCVNFPPESKDFLLFFGETIIHGQRSTDSGRNIDGRQRDLLEVTRY
jgi:hypothetical protein